MTRLNVLYITNFKTLMLICIMRVV